ncbi:HAD family hydrolase [Candidatus Woesearchaeota archaeon]|nr:HAD family hydrolase [Candidatus Woesearchaeota archaeon]
MIKGVLFDFWGTLVENGVYSPLRQAKKILGINMPFGKYVVRFEKALMLSNKSLEDGFRQVFDAFNIPFEQAVLDELVALWRENAEKAELYPETKDVLEDLKANDIKLCLISNTDSFSVNQVLSKTTLRKYLDAIVLSCAVGCLKTNPRMFYYALKMLNLQKNEVVMVGDSIESDVIGAKKAGIKVILVDRKNKREFQPKINNLSELKEMLENLN